MQKTNDGRPNGKAWKKKWGGKPPSHIVLEAQAQSNKSKKKGQQS